MTAPRQILPGRIYLVTRRCLLRHFFLRPGPVVNQVFAYVLALAAQRYGVQVHAFCVLSNQCDRTDVRRSPGTAGRLSGPSQTLAREGGEVDSLAEEPLPQAPQRARAKAIALWAFLIAVFWLLDLR
jgi:hypothetical protein